MNKMGVTGTTTIFQYYCKSSKVTKIQLEIGSIIGKKDKTRTISKL